MVHDPATGLNAVGGVPAPSGLAEGTSVKVGAVYAMDGFTGGIIWRYQTPSFSTTSVGSPNSFTAQITGDAHSATTAGAQPFQVGPTAHDTTGAVSDSAPTPPLAGADSFTPGTFTTYAPVGNLNAGPASKLKYAIYAKTATVNAGNTVTYPGDWRIFPTGSNADDANILASGTFTATATFDLTVDPTGRFANVVGTFSADAATSPTFAAGFPAQFNGTFASRPPGAPVIRSAPRAVLGKAMQSRMLLRPA